MNEYAPVIENYVAPQVPQQGLGSAFLRSRVGKAMTGAALTVGFMGAAPAIADANTTHFDFDAAPTALTANKDAQIGHVASVEEGQDGNNLSCDPITTKKELIYLAKGGADSCGHTDIGKDWAAIGFTLQDAERAQRGTICSDENVESEGREVGPDASENKELHIDGHVIFARPLSVWGNLCYDAWVTHGEDGHIEGALVGCGNGEGELMAAPKPKPHPKPKKPSLEELELFKEVITQLGAVLPEAPLNTFNFDVTITKPGGKPHTRPFTLTSDPEIIGKYPAGTKFLLHEGAANGPDFYDPLTADQHGTIRKVTKVVVFKDEELTDVCKNLPGPQPALPAGYEYDVNGNCVPIPPTPTPGPCENIPSATVVPAGYYINASGDCVPIPPTPTPAPPTIVGYNQPPGLEQPMEGESYVIYWQADAPSGDKLQVTAKLNNPDCATLSPVTQPSSSGDIYEATIAASEDPSCVGVDETVTATAEDVNTGISAGPQDPSVEDLGGILAQPSYGN